MMPRRTLPGRSGQRATSARRDDTQLLERQRRPQRVQQEPLLLQPRQHTPMRTVSATPVGSTSSH
jgi:hypothetical protein